MNQFTTSTPNYSNQVISANSFEQLSILYPLFDEQLTKPTALNKLRAIRNDKNQQKGWVCNISLGFRFSSGQSNQIQISYKNLLNPTFETSQSSEYALINKQYEYLCQLLKAGTCKVIYFDATFSKEQLLEIRLLQTNCKTELVNARLAFMFSNRRIA